MPGVEVNVTDRDINAGVPGHPYACAVALALDRFTGRNVRPSLGGEDCDTISLRVGWRARRCKVHKLRTPEHVRGFADDFDSGGNVYPITFTLDLPEEVID